MFDVEALQKTSEGLALLSEVMAFGDWMASLETSDLPPMREAILRAGAIVDRAIAIGEPMEPWVGGVLAPTFGAAMIALYVQRTGERTKSTAGEDFLRVFDYFVEQSAGART